MSASDPTDAAQLRRERDLYLRLLGLGQQEALEPFLREALALVVELTDSAQGYLELHDTEAGDDAGWSLAHGFSAAQVADVRRSISRGIIAAALAGGETVVTDSAREDPRFSERESVRIGRIEAVLCAPIAHAGQRGAVYLRRPAAAGPYRDDDRARVELFARHVGPTADRLLLRRRLGAHGDATRPWRDKLRAEAVIGHSAALAGALRGAALVAPLDVAVLLTGDSGTGKTQLARVIHDSGPRAGGPFQELNCAAFTTEELLESNLFGSEKGGHSQADRRIEGRVAAAEGGTLFLDEVGEMPPRLQAALLQLLHSKQYFPLGAARPLQADVRVIAATNSDLEAAVAAGRFREDLYYRLRVVPIRMPALAERRDDLDALATHLCDAACARHGLAALSLSPNARLALQAAEWPGNIRQLANAIEAAAIYAHGDGVLHIEPRHLFPDAAPAAPLAAAETFQQATRVFQAALLRRTLDESEWNISETARRLDLTRGHIYSLLRAFGIARTP